MSHKGERIMKKTILSLILITAILTAGIVPAFAASKKTTKTIEATIEKLDFKSNTINVLDYNGKTHNIKIYPSTDIVIEGIGIGIADLYFGQEVDIRLVNNKADRIIAYPEDDPERYGYIVPGSRVKTGDILFISENQIEIKGQYGREKYRISPSTELIKNKTRANLFQLKAGDKVVLSFDDIYTTEVSTIRIQDQEEYIEGIIKGKIHSVNEKSKEILIKIPYTYKEGMGWRPYSDHMAKLKLNGGQLYNMGENISLKQLKNFLNQDVYIAYNMAYGNMNISKLQIKNGAHRIYQAKVDNIEYTKGNMVVDKNLIHLNEGTIVVKDNRLVDILNINRKEDVFVNTDRIMGRNLASFVSIEGTTILDDRLDNTKLVLYRGKIEDISEYEIQIGKLNYRLDHMKLSDNRWKEVKGSEKFELSQDTLIYDSELKQIIPADYFISSRYINLNDIKDHTLRERVKGSFYKNKTAYFVVKESPYGSELLGLNITPHINQYRQNIIMNYSTTGEIEEIDQNNGNIKFTKVKNFNTLNNRWENTGEEVIDIKSSIILLNDIPVPADKAYLLRKGSKAYIIKNKDSSIDKAYIILIEDWLGLGQF